MVSDSFRKDLINHKIYSALQFIEYTEKNIDTVRYCANTINNIIGKMEIKTIRWEQEIFDDLVEAEMETGEKVKQLTITTDNIPQYELRVAGEKIDPWFLFGKLIRDFFQYTMNSFDSISQIINAGLLANKGKKYDSVDIQRITSCFNQQTYSADFPKMNLWLNKLTQSPEFKYIEAINNRTKHTGDIAQKLSMGILGGNSLVEIGTFCHKKNQYGKYEIPDLLQDIQDFLYASWDEFSKVFEEEYKRDVYNQNRLHEISGVHQQRIKDKPEQDLSYAYFISNTDFDSMPDEIYVLLIHEEENEIHAHECPFDTILITGSNDRDVLGRYCAEETISDDCLLHYRKYIKDNITKGLICVAYEKHKITTFYHANQFFTVTSITNDDEFAQRTLLPF